MLAHGKNIEWLCCCQGPVAYAHRQRSVALRAEIGRSQAVWGVRIRIVFRRVGEAGFTAQTHYRARRSARHSFDPCARSSTFASLRLRAFAFLSSRSRDLYGRSTTFAPLRSFLPTAGISARDLLPIKPYALSCPSPPPPTPPANGPGGEGEPSGWICSRSLLIPKWN